MSDDRLKRHVNPPALAVPIPYNPRYFFPMIRKNIGWGMALLTGIITLGTWTVNIITTRVELREHQRAEDVAKALIASDLTAHIQRHDVQLDQLLTKVTVVDGKVERQSGQLETIIHQLDKNLSTMPSGGQNARGGTYGDPHITFKNE